MAIQYAGGTIVNTTFTGATRTNIVNSINTHLKTAGWTAISGDGTGDVILESATTPTAANKIRVRLRDSNLTNCACINMQNESALKVSQNYFLLPAAAKTFRIIANMYQFFCFTPGASVAREFVAMGVPYIPSFLHGVVTADLGWIQGNASSDTDTQVRSSFRTMLGSNGQDRQYWSGLVNVNLADVANSNFGNRGGDQALVIPASNRPDAFTVGGYRWHDDSLVLSDPLIAWGLTTNADEGKIRGQLWDAMVASDPFAGDTPLSSVDSHNWHAITNNNIGVLATSSNTMTLRGTLFVATS